MALTRGTAQLSVRTGLDMLHGHKKRRKSKRKKSKSAVSRAFHEVFANVPSTVRRAKVSGARKHKMMVAIALEKARKAGAHIPRKGRRRS